MRNKYMRRGILFLLGGIALTLVGWYTEKQNLDIYKWEMGIGTVIFGLGFLMILYSLIRKVERASILEERAEEHDHPKHPHSSDASEVAEKPVN